MPRASKPNLLSRIFRGFLVLVLVFGLIGPVLVVSIYRFVPPPITFLMVQRAVEGRGAREGRPRVAAQGDNRAA